MNNLTIFLMLVLWAGTQIASNPVDSPSSSEEQNDDDEQDFGKKVKIMMKKVTDVKKGKPISEAEFKKAKSINKTSGPPRSNKSDDNPLLTAGLFEGDILMLNVSDIRKLNMSEIMSKSNRTGKGYSAIGDPRQKWAGGVIPYEISHTFTIGERLVIAAAMVAYHLTTCIRFVPKTSAHTDYIVFVDGKGCNSWVGRIGGGQAVTLGPNCLYYGVVVHELMHAIGFWHEQSRADRDQYVTINWNNIQKDQDYNFQKYEWGFIQHLNTNYDYNSIMHYDSYAFTQTAGQPTLLTKSGGLVYRQNQFSAQDISRIKTLYKCAECVDADAECLKFAHAGECVKNPGWMLKHCKRSCWVCE